MRAKDRIDSFITEIENIWVKYPDLRFGQLMTNLFFWGKSKYGDSFYWEDDKFLQYLKEFVSEFR